MRPGGEAGSGQTRADEKDERAGHAAQDRAKMLETAGTGGKQAPDDTETDEADRCSHDHAARRNRYASAVGHVPRANGRAREASGGADINETLAWFLLTGSLLPRSLPRG